MKSRLNPTSVFEVRASWGSIMTERVMRIPIFTWAGVLDPKKGAIAIVGASRISPKQKSASADMGAYSLKAEKKLR
jgi:hypothetical protein